MLYTLYFTQTLKRCSPITGYQNCTVHSILQVWPPPHVDAVWGGHDCLHDWSGRVSTAGAQRLANRDRQQTPVLHTARTAAGLRGMYLVYYETVSYHCTRKCCISLITNTSLGLCMSARRRTEGRDPVGSTSDSY